MNMHGNEKNIQCLILWLVYCIISQKTTWATGIGVTDGGILSVDHESTQK